LEYLNKQNRPYNHKMIFENIHGKDIGLSETVVKTICANLAENNQVSTKNYNNKPLYWAKQDQHEDLDPEQLKALDLDLAKLKAKDEELKLQVRNTWKLGN
jgi:26S proteasome regulatory subunit (ATPase 3-interacting protein)